MPVPALVAHHADVVRCAVPDDRAARDRLAAPALRAAPGDAPVDLDLPLRPVGVVEEGVEVGLGAVAPSGHQQARPVHQVGGPQVVDVWVGEGQGVGLAAGIRQLFGLQRQAIDAPKSE